MLERLNKIRAKLFPINMHIQMLVLAEETGEAIQQWRRWSGNARTGEGSPETMEKLRKELADVIITAKISLLELGFDPDQAVADKLSEIERRGGK